MSCMTLMFSIDPGVKGNCQTYLSLRRQAYLLSGTYLEVPPKFCRNSPTLSTSTLPRPFPTFISSLWSRMSRLCGLNFSARNFQAYARGRYPGSAAKRCIWPLSSPAIFCLSVSSASEYIFSSVERTCTLRCSHALLAKFQICKK